MRARPRQPRWWMRPVHAFFGYFNRGFEALSHGYGWLTARMVRFAVLMLVVYGGVIAFGLNEFRKTPAGFIPQLDAGYLIVVTQLPGGASLARTDAVNRQVVDIALEVPGVAHAVNFAGFSGATFTNAPNSGAIFLPLEPFETRARDPKKSAAAIQGALFQRFASIQEALVVVVMPPPVRGIGTSGGFRMMVEDRGDAGPQALQGAVYAMMGRAAQTPGLAQVFSLFETSTPQLYLDIDRTKVQMLGVAMSDVFGALQTYLGSTYVNDFNLLGRMFRVTAQADAAYRLDPKDVLKIRVRNAARRHGAARLLHDRARRLRSLPRAALQPLPRGRARRRPRARLLAGPGARAHAEARRRDAAAGLQLRVDRRSPTSSSAPATPPCSPSCWRWCSCSSCSPPSTRA